MAYFNNIPDHPVIRNCERTGWPDGKEPKYPVCPICREEAASDIIFNHHGDIIGCEDCITCRPADEYFKTETNLICPVCHQACESIYLSANNEPLGCDQCVKIKDPWEVLECFPD